MTLPLSYSRSVVPSLLQRNANRGRQQRGAWRPGTRGAGFDDRQLVPAQVEPDADVKPEFVSCFEDKLGVARPFCSTYFAQRPLCSVGRCQYITRHAKRSVQTDMLLHSNDQIRTRDFQNRAWMSRR